MQLQALQKNDEPWMNHGIQTCYEFGYDIGGLDPSYYFGFRKDLYHFDHFMGQFATYLPELINLTSYTLQSSSLVENDDEAGRVVALVTDSTGRHSASFQFALRKRHVGTRQGSYMTYSITRTTQ